MNDVIVTRCLNLCLAGACITSVQEGQGSQSVQCYVQQEVGRFYFLNVEIIA